MKAIVKNTLEHIVLALFVGGLVYIFSSGVDSIINGLSLSNEAQEERRVLQVQSLEALENINGQLSDIIIKMNYE